MEDDLKKLTLCLDQYMYFVTKNISLEKYSPDIKNIPIDKVLSFNYTNTYEKYYEDDLHVEYCYIHGQAGNHNLVLGFQEYLKDHKKNNQLLCIHFKKFFQRIYKGTGCEYKKWLSSSEKHQIYFLGHSLDITDGDIIREIILNENVEKVTIYYHDEETHARQIMNLVRIITQNELIKRTFSENQKIAFKKQEWMNEIKDKN